MNSMLTYTSMEKYNIKFEDYRDRLSAIYPWLDDEGLEMIFNARLIFRGTIIE